MPDTTPTPPERPVSHPGRRPTQSPHTTRPDPAATPTDTDGGTAVRRQGEPGETGTLPDLAAYLEEGADEHDAGGAVDLPARARTAAAQLRDTAGPCDGFWASVAAGDLRPPPAWLTAAGRQDLLARLAATDAVITPKHVAARFRDLLATLAAEPAGCDPDPDRLSRLIAEHEASQDHEAAGFRPARGDGVEAWIKNRRDAHPVTAPAWSALDDLLDDYRLHADTGMPLAAATAGEAGPDGSDLSGRDLLQGMVCLLNERHGSEWSGADVIQLITSLAGDLGVDPDRGLPPGGGCDQDVTA